MTIWFTADHHLGHANILRHAGRPFADVTAMGEALIERWNARVRPDDEVWHLGDFCWGDARLAESYRQHLNGRIHLITGNHDRTGVRELPGWASVGEVRTLKINGHVIVLCHFPFESWDRSFHGSIHLHGHTHGMLPARGRRLDVGVDAGWAAPKFSPISLDEVVAWAMQREPSAT